MIEAIRTRFRPESLDLVNHGADNQTIQKKKNPIENKLERKKNPVKVNLNISLNAICNPSPNM